MSCFAVSLLGNLGPISKNVFENNLIFFKIENNLLIEKYMFDKIFH